MGSPGIDMRRVNEIVREQTKAAHVMAAIEHGDDNGTFRVEPVIQGIGLSFRFGSRELARTIECMDGTHWSVTVKGVVWRLPPNDGRRMLSRDGTWNCTYVVGPEIAILLAMPTLRKRLESRRPRLILPMVDPLSTTRDADRPTRRPRATGSCRRSAAS